jgi:DNA repair protein RadC
VAHFWLANPAQFWIALKSELLRTILEAPSAQLPRYSDVALATALNRLGGLGGLLEADDTTLVRELGPTSARLVLAVMELARRLARSNLTRRPSLDHPAAIAEYLALRYASADQEIMGALYLDVRSRLIADKELFRGTLSRIAVEPRQILKQALLHSASGLVLFHNHPSGDPAPSLEDLAFTRRLDEAAKLLNIRLEDHIIVASGGRWVSLSRRGGW